jgi:hypothetical protein
MARNHHFPEQIVLSSVIHDLALMDSPLGLGWNFVQTVKPL